VLGVDNFLAHFNIFRAKTARKILLQLKIKNLFLNFFAQRSINLAIAYLARPTLAQLLLQERSD
jgi:hypothetical protein